MSQPKIILVTGGNSGVGFETAKAFLESKNKYHIILGSRTLEKADKAIASLHEQCPETNNTIEGIQLDISNDESIESAFKRVSATSGHIDALINNAGATFDLEYVGGRLGLRDTFNQAYNVNVAGTNVMTHIFMPLLLKSSDPRLIFVAGLSQMTEAAVSYFPTPEQPAGWPKNIAFETIGYRCSKTALNMLMLDWNHKLKADGVKVWSVGPGFLATNLGNVPELAKEMGAKHPSAGGQLMREVVEGQRDDDVGKIVVADGISAW